MAMRCISSGTVSLPAPPMPDKHWLGTELGCIMLFVPCGLHQARAKARASATCALVATITNRPREWV